MRNILFKQRAYFEIGSLIRLHKKVPLKDESKKNCRKETGWGRHLFGAHFPCGPRLRPRKIVLKSIKFSFHKGPRCKSALSRDGAAENIKYKSNSCAIIVGRLELFRCEFSRRGKAPHLRFCPLFFRRPKRSLFCGFRFRFLSKKNWNAFCVSFFYRWTY